MGDDASHCSEQAAHMAAVLGLAHRGDQRFSLSPAVSEERGTVCLSLYTFLYVSKPWITTWRTVGLVGAKTKASS